MTDVNHAPGSEGATIVVADGTATPIAQVQPGEKTDSAQLLKSLQEERELRRQEQARSAGLEAELSAFKQAPPVNGEFSDEGKVLLSKIAEVESKINADTQVKLIDQLKEKYPALQDKATEFETFRALDENAGRKLEVVAKDFLIENDLFDPAPARRGLERNTGGGRTPTTTGMTVEEIADLRENNYRKYSQMVADGKISL